jgi:uncharacterized protein (TIGR03437 family)
VLVTGGWGGSLAEIFDPTTGKFTPTGAFDSSGVELGAALLDGTALTAGSPSFIYHPNKLIRAPALFTLSGSGTGQGAIWNPATGQPGSAQNPAAAGDILSMYTTSLIEGGVMPPQVSVGGLLAKVLFFGDAPGYPGYFQVNFQLPSGVTPGSAAPVRLMYFGRSSNATTIAVH